MTSKIIPKNYGDFLSVISFIGFLFIFLETISEVSLSQFTTSIFLIVSGAGLITIGRLFTITRWARDGLQGREFNYFFTSIFGIFSIVAGILSLPQANILVGQLNGIIMASSFASMLFIAIAYMNRRRC